VVAKEGHDGGSRLSQLTDFGMETLVLTGTSREASKDTLKSGKRFGVARSYDGAPFLAICPEHHDVVECPWLDFLPKQKHGVWDTPRAGQTFYAPISILSRSA
jgi:hypothetical protein